MVLKPYTNFTSDDSDPDSTQLITSSSAEAQTEDLTTFYMTQSEYIQCIIIINNYI